MTSSSDAGTAFIQEVHAFLSIPAWQPTAAEQAANTIDGTPRALTIPTVEMIRRWCDVMFRSEIRIGADHYAASLFRVIERRGQAGDLVAARFVALRALSLEVSA